MSFVGHFYGKLVEQLTERRQLIADELLRGDPADYADYKGRVGEAKGLQYALNAAEELQRQMTADDRPQNTN